MKVMLYTLFAVAVTFFCACTPDEKVLDRFNSVEFVALVDDTTGLLLVKSNEKVEFYSSYISGMDERTDVVGRKYVYVDMRKEKVYKKVDYPLSKPMNWAVISDSLLLFYWSYDKNGKSELTKASAWNYHSNVLENWSVVSRETLPTNVALFLRSKCPLSTHKIGAERGHSCPEKIPIQPSEIHFLNA